MRHNAKIRGGVAVPLDCLVIPMKILPLTLKKKWFDMILAGEKAEEYREIKDYWATRFLCGPKEIEWQCWQEMLEDMRQPFLRHNGPSDLMNFFGVKFKGYEAIRFRNGYQSDAPSFDIEIKGFDLKQGREDWGAEKDRFYFVFALGRILDGASV